MNTRRLFLLNLCAVFLFFLHPVQGQTYYWAPGGTLGGNGNMETDVAFAPNSDGSGTLVALTSLADNVSIEFGGTVGGLLTKSAFKQWGTATFTSNDYTINPTFLVNVGGTSAIVLEDNVTLGLFENATSGSLTGSSAFQNITGGTNSQLEMRMGSTDLTKSFALVGQINVPISVTGTNGTAILAGASGTGTSTSGRINGAVSVADGITLRLTTSDIDRRLRFNSNISGDIDVELAPLGTTAPNDPVRGVLLLAASSYTGDTIMRSTAAKGLVILQTNNALPTATNLIFGTGAADGGRMQMEGRNQTVASLSSNANAIGNIQNHSVTASTLTINGSSTDTFGLVIGKVASLDGGEGVVNLVRSGSGTTILTGNNTYTGTTLVSGTSMLVVNGDQSAATGTVTVDSGATLGGSGVIGGATTINGILAPGNSTDVLSFESTLTLGSTATSNFEINGLTRETEYDGADVAGLLTYDGDLVLALSGTYDVNDSWNLFNFGSFAGNFDSVELTGSYVGNLTQNGNLWTGTLGGNEWQFNQADGVLSVIPEPATGLLILLGLGGVLLRRRRS